MNVLLLDTNVVSVLFNKNHSLRPACLEAVAGRQLVISFMSLAELLLWPAANNWGASRRAALETHLDRYTTLYPAIRMDARARSGAKPSISAGAPEGRSIPRTPGSHRLDLLPGTDLRG